MSGRISFGDYLLASLVLSGGLFLDYLCAILFGNWLASSNLPALLSTFLCGFFSVFFISLGLSGFLLRPGREARVLVDRIILQSEWRFDNHETVIPLQRVWKFYANLKNDFPWCFIVWRDEKDRCKLIGFDKEDIPDFHCEVSRLKERVTVDTESYAIASFVRQDVKEKLGCKPAW